MNPALINVYTTPSLPPFLLGQRVEPFSVGPKPRNERLVMHILAEILRKSRKQLAFDVLDPAKQVSQCRSNDLGSLQPSVQFELFQNLQVAGGESDCGDLRNFLHPSTNLPAGPDDSMQLKCQPASVSNINDIQSEPLISAFVMPLQGSQNAGLSAVVSSLPPEAKALPTDWLLAPKSASFIQRVLFRLIQAEEREAEVHLRDDYRQAFICLSLASRGNTEPFLVSSYQMYGKHPDLVWPAIMAKRAAKLGKEFGQWYSTDGQLLPDVGVPKKPAAPDTPNKRIAVLLQVSAGVSPVADARTGNMVCNLDRPQERGITAEFNLPSLPASADGTGAASPTSSQAAPLISKKAGIA